MDERYSLREVSEMLTESNGFSAGEQIPLRERLAELELALEDRGWLRFGQMAERDFSQAGLKKIIKLSRLMYIKNPLINRGVNVGQYYVWAQGVRIRQTNEKRDRVLQQFLRDNRDALTGHQARTALEVELQVTGNLFLAHLIGQQTGRITTRPIVVEEIQEIVNHPNDKWRPMLYKRVRVEGSKAIEEYHPDWKWMPRTKPALWNNVPIIWSAPLQHIKVGGTGDMKFGVPETYQALDWARAYKEFCEDWASITKSLQRFAWSLTTKGGISKLKDKIETTLGTGGSGDEDKPPPVAGSTFIGRGVELTPIPKTGANVSMEDGRRLVLMVAAAFGLPECYSDDTEVLTESGWMRHGEWKGNPRVACFDPETGRTQWQHPRALTEHYYNGEMVHFANAQTDILVTPNHRMWTAPVVQWNLLPARKSQSTNVGRKRVADGGVAVVDRSWQVRLAEEIADSPRSQGWQFTSDLRFPESTPTGTLSTPIGEVDAVTWARLLGYWISEGSAPGVVCKSGEFRKDGTPIMRLFRRVLLSQHEGSVLTAMRRTLDALGVYHGITTASRGVRNIVIYHKPLWEYLRSHCGENSHAKRIPDELMSASADVRRALFDALMDGDGGRSGESLRYSSVSATLADQMQLLAMSLGYGASVTTEEREYRGAGRRIYRVWIRSRLTATSNLKPRHIQRVPYSGWVYCLSVPTGFYVTRRNGKIAIQGNTFFGDADVGNHATATTLDRPTELKFRDRQSLWVDEYADMEAFAALQASIAPEGTSGLGIRLENDGEFQTVVQTEADAGETKVEFPPILEHDLASVVDAIVKAATLDGKPMAEVLETEQVQSMLLSALANLDIGQDMIEAAGMMDDFRAVVQEVRRELRGARLAA